MTVSVKAPTSTTGSIQLNGSDVLTIDSSNQITTTAPLTVKASTSSATIKINGRSSDNLGGLFFYANDGTTESARITASASEYRVTSQSTAVQTFYTSGAERMRIDSSGKVLVNTTSAVGTGKFVSAYNTTGYCATMYSVGNGADYIQFWNGSEVGTIKRVGGTGVAYNTSSDYRLKENVAPMSGSIDRLKQLKPCTWTWKIDGSNGQGFVAHEAQTVVPEAVSGTKDAMRTEEYEVTPAVLNDDGNVVTEAVMGTREVPDYQGIDQSKLVPLLTAALQEAITKIEDLESRIQALESA